MPKVSLSDAEHVRSRKSALLKAAHTTAIGMVTRGGKKTPAIMAFFEKKPKKPLPAVLTVTKGDRRLTVPLVVRVSPRPIPE